MKCNKPTILIIDDELAILDLCKSILCNDYNVLIASNAMIGIEIANVVRIDLIITDLKMPGDVDGFDICKQFAKRIPIMILTGVYDLDDKQFTHLEVFKKPFCIYKFRESVNKLISTARYRRVS